jgi:hypothetical protein
MPVSLIRWKTLTYARGTLGIGCIRFKHGRIRWHTARQKIFFKHAQNFCAYSDVWFIRFAYFRHTLNMLEVRQMYGTHTLAFQRIFVRMKIISLIFIRFSYVSLIRNSVTEPLTLKGSIAA